MNTLNCKLHFVGRRGDGSANKLTNNQIRHIDTHTNLDLRYSHRKKLRVTVYAGAQRRAMTGKRTLRRDYTHCAQADARAREQTRTHCFTPAHTNVRKSR